ncbi:hypothetical protein [Sodalis praecaptivus]|nr:hypothetical protein [Sodalis praecaptivus]CAJ0999086.1 hypothetical protein NVIRENTERO_03647 [Sodalis praecaptivus]
MNHLKRMQHRYRLTGADLRRHTGTLVTGALYLLALLCAGTLFLSIARTL